jgi:methyl-accepting chemotaxis protein
MFKLRDLNIGPRLLLAFGSILLILTLSVGVGIWRLQSLAATARSLGSVESEKLFLALKWRDLVELNWARTQGAVRDADVSKLRVWQDEMDKSTNAAGTDLKRIRDLVKDSDAQPLVAAIDAARDTYRLARVEVLKRKQAGEDVSAALENELRPKSVLFIDAIDQFVHFQRANVDRALREAEQNARDGQLILGIGGISALALAALLAWMLARSIVLPLQQATASARRIAQGDLGERMHVEGHDEASGLQAALMEMQRALARLVSDVRLNSESVATASAQISQGNTLLSG